MVWRTTEDADFDLQFLVEQGTAQFGRKASGAYFLRLIDMFELLAAHPEAGGERVAARRRIRLMPCGSHNILYVVEDEDVIILRVLHGLQDWFDLL